MGGQLGVTVGVALEYEEPRFECDRLGFCRRADDARPGRFRSNFRSLGRFQSFRDRFLLWGATWMRRICCRWQHNLQTDACDTLVQPPQPQEQARQSDESLPRGHWRGSQIELHDRCNISKMPGGRAEIGMVLFFSVQGLSKMSHLRMT